MELVSHRTGGGGRGGADRGCAGRCAYLSVTTEVSLLRWAVALFWKVCRWCFFQNEWRDGPEEGARQRTGPAKGRRESEE